MSKIVVYLLKFYHIALTEVRNGFEIGMRDLSSHPRHPSPLANVHGLSPTGSCLKSHTQEAWVDRIFFPVFVCPFFCFGSTQIRTLTNFVSWVNLLSCVRCTISIIRSWNQIFGCNWKSTYEQKPIRASRFNRANVKRPSSSLIISAVKRQNSIHSSVCWFLPPSLHYRPLQRKWSCLACGENIQRGHVLILGQRTYRLAKWIRTEEINYPSWCIKFKVYVNFTATVD